jgi:hypothetical protein
MTSEYFKLVHKTSRITICRVFFSSSIDEDVKLHYDAAQLLSTNNVVPDVFDILY